MLTPLENCFRAKLDDQVQEGLEKLCNRYSITEDEINEKWEAYACNEGIKGPPTEPNLQKFADHISQSHTGLLKKMYNQDTIRAKVKEVGSKVENRVLANLKTPIKPKRLEELSSPLVGSSAFSPGVKTLPESPVANLNNSKSGTVKSSLNDAFPAFKSTSKTTVSVAQTDGQQRTAYRYLYERLTEKGDVLDSRINFFTDIVGKELYAAIDGPAAEEITNFQFMFEHPSMVNQEPKYYIGRVSTDAINSDFQLNTNSCVLETNREFGGERVSLEFSLDVLSDRAFDVFPGQIIAFEGTNPTGSKLIVQRMIALPKLLSPITTGFSYRSCYQSSEDNNLSIVCCAGPYTEKSNLEYRLLSLLIKNLESNPPDLIIMCGPFVDCNHECFVSGTVDETDESIFKKVVAVKIQQLKELKPGLRVILIPAITDSCLEWAAFPQPPFGTSFDTKSEFSNLHGLGLMDHDGELIADLFPNPVQFAVNEVVVAATSVDSVGDIFRFHTNKHTDLRAELGFKHMIEQRHFYPLYPPFINLDTTRALSVGAEGACNLKFKPNLIIAPSRMTSVAKIVDEVLCVSPGSVFLGPGIGTFARLYIQGLNTSEMVDEDEFSADISSRTRAEIVFL